MASEGGDEKRLCSTPDMFFRSGVSVVLKDKKTKQNMATNYCVQEEGKTNGLTLELKGT